MQYDSDCFLPETVKLPEAMPILLYAFFCPKNPSTFHLLCYLFVFKTFAAEQLGVQTFQQ